MRKPTKEEIQNVLDYFNSSDPKMSQGLYTQTWDGCLVITDPDEIILCIEHQEEWNAQKLGTTVELYREWVSNLNWNDSVLLTCAGTTTKGKPCQHIALRCDGFHQWLKYRHTAPCCSYHTKS